MESTNLKSDNKQSIDLNLFSKSSDALNKETSFIDQQLINQRNNRNGPSVLLKHNVSKASLNNFRQNLQKSKSASYLAELQTPSDKLKNELTNSYLTSTPNLFMNSTSKLDQLSSNSDRSSSLNGLPPAILCRNVSFDYDDSKLNKTNVLKNVNLNCQIGSIYGLLGPSGCG